MSCLPGASPTGPHKGWLKALIFKKTQDPESITDVKQKLRKSIFAPASTSQKSSGDKPVTLVNRESVAIQKHQPQQQQERLKLERKAKLLERKLREVEAKLKNMSADDIVVIKSDRLHTNPLTDEQFIASVKAVINNDHDHASLSGSV